VTRHGAFRRSLGLAALVISAVALPSGVAFAGVAFDITAPAPGATYEVGQPVTIGYTCTSEFQIFQCDLSDGSGRLVPGTQLDTSIPGEFDVGAAFVDAEPSDGVFRYLYTVVPAEPPTVTITTPANGARYSALATLFRPVRVSYSCSDAVSGVQSCTGTRANGARLDTFFTALGRHSFTVTARDRAGNTTTVTHTYTVTL
jgi:hypothetical protein